MERKKYDKSAAIKYEHKRKNAHKKTTKTTWEFEHNVVYKILHKYCPLMIMDAPVGTGRFFDIYKKLGCKVTGIDISKDMLEQARRKDFDCTLIHGSLFDYEFFNFTICMRFWGHMDDNERLKVLSKVKKFLLFSHRTSVDNMLSEAGLSVFHRFNRGRDKKGNYFITLAKR